MLKSPVVLFLAGLLVGCSQHTMESMRSNFQESMQRNVGLKLTQVTDSEFQFIGLRKPAETQELENGSILYVYRDYWPQYQIDRTPCTVYLEVHHESNVITSARSEGSGCYMPY